MLQDPHEWCKVLFFIINKALLVLWLCSREPFGIKAKLKQTQLSLSPVCYLDDDVVISWGATAKPCVCKAARVRQWSVSCCTLGRGFKSSRLLWNLASLLSQQDLQWELHSPWPEGGAVLRQRGVELPHAVGEALASALPGYHAAQAPPGAVVSGPQSWEADPKVWGGPSDWAVVKRSLQRTETWVWQGKQPLNMEELFYFGLRMGFASTWACHFSARVPLPAVAVWGLNNGAFN